MESNKAEPEIRLLPIATDREQRPVRRTVARETDTAILALRRTLASPLVEPHKAVVARRDLAQALQARALELMASAGAPELPCDDAAIATLREAVALRPDFADLQYNLGLAHLSRREFADAIPPLGRAVDINPQYARASLALGIALYSCGNEVRGLERARHALSLDPTLRRTALREAEAAHLRGERVVAIDALWSMSDAEGGENPFYHARFARELFRRGLYVDAETEYKMAILLNPGFADLHNQLGLTRFALLRDKEAIESFRNAIAVNPDYAEAHVNIARSLVRMGRRDEARSSFVMALAIDSMNAEARAGLAGLEQKLPRL